jgi:hypothetical protein
MLRMAFHAPALGEGALGNCAAQRFPLDATDRLGSKIQEESMATDHHHHDVPAMDYDQHEKTFGLFAGLIKWGTVGSLLIVLLAGAFTHTVPWAFAIVVSVLLTMIVAKFF